MMKRELFLKLKTTKIIMITTAYEEKNMMKEPNIMIRRLKPIEMLGFVPFILPLHYITLHFKSFLVLHSSFPLALFICNGTQVKHEMNKAKEERETEPGTVCALFLLCSLGLFRASLSYHYK